MVMLLTIEEVSLLEDMFSLEIETCAIPFAVDHYLLFVGFVCQG